MTLRIYQPDQADNEEDSGDKPQRIGIFGGSFDPVHNGHLALARACRESANLDEVWFIPTTVQPLKPYGPIASNEARLEMLRLAIESLPEEEKASYRISTIEIDRGGTSYTVDTLNEISKRHPRAELFLLMGADTLRSFPKWHKPVEVLSLATPIVVHRAGEPLPDFEVIAEYVGEELLDEFRQLVVAMSPMPISSSAIRESFHLEDPMTEALPLSVIDYLQEESLYLSTP